MVGVQTSEYTNNHLRSRNVRRQPESANSDKALWPCHDYPKKRVGGGRNEGHDEILTLELPDVAAKREIQTLDKVLAIIPHII